MIRLIHPKPISRGWAGRAVLLAALLVPLCAHMAAQGQTPAYREEDRSRSTTQSRGGVDEIDTRIIIDPPSGFTAEIWTDSSRYRSGDEIRVYFRVSRDAYIHIHNTDARGVSRQLLPNYYDRENYARAHTVYSIPTSSYNLRVSGPSGRESLEIIAISESPDFLRRYESFQKADPFPLRPRGSEDFMRELNQENDRRELELQRETQRRSVEEARPVKPESRLENEKSLPDRRGDRSADRETRPGVIIDPPDRHPRPVQIARGETSFTVGDGRRNDEYSILEIQTKPNMAQVRVNGRYAGNTPVNVRLASGEHEIEITKAGYRDVYHVYRVDSTLRRQLVVVLQREEVRTYIPVVPPRYRRDDRRDRRDDDAPNLERHPEIDRLRRDWEERMNQENEAARDQLDRLRDDMERPVVPPAAPRYRVEERSPAPEGAVPPPAPEP
jgi:hypothetical protein